MKQLSLAASDGQRPHTGGASLMENPGALFDGRACCENIVDEKEVAVSHGIRLPYLKGAAQVFHALGAVQTCLRCGISRSAERSRHRLPGSLRKERRDRLRLVEAALALACRVKRDWHQVIEWADEDPFVRESDCGPIREGSTQVVCTIVFKAVEEIADHTRAAIPRDSAVKVELATAAIGAGELACDVAVERLRTLATKWGLDFQRSIPTSGTDKSTGWR